MDLLSCKTAERWAAWYERARRLCAEERGQTTIEWALIVAVVALPMLVVFRICLNLLVAKYRMITFLNSMPFP
ncbi:MAG: hypothetical protein HQ546_06590 [Planctomycetes bacterium]|nr:hypothetical protein [Planctomycetota bacterium]